MPRTRPCAAKPEPTCGPNTLRRRRPAVDADDAATHGRHGLPRALLGSVAEKVVRLSPVPVLTLHEPPPQAEKADGARSLLSSYRAVTATPVVHGMRFVKGRVACGSKRRSWWRRTSANL